MCHLVRPLLAALLLGLSLTAGATETDTPKDTLGIHLFSQHIPKADYNNINPGLYYRLKEGPVAGIYRNSVRRTSVYAGYTWQYGRFDLTTGAVTGYTNGAQLLLVPSVAMFTVHGATARLAFIPRIEKRIGSHVLHVAVEI